MRASEISNMSIVERLQAMEAIWDSLLQEGVKVESPDWHESVLEDRSRTIENGTAKIISLDELKASF